MPSGFEPPSRANPLLKALADSAIALGQIYGRPSIMLLSGYLERYLRHNPDVINFLSENGVRSPASIARVLGLLNIVMPFGLPPLPPSGPIVIVLTENGDINSVLDQLKNNECEGTEISVVNRPRIYVIYSECPFLSSEAGESLKNINGVVNVLTGYDAIKYMLGLVTSGSPPHPLVYAVKRLADITKDFSPGNTAKNEEILDKMRDLLCNELPRMMGPLVKYVDVLCSLPELSLPTQFPSGLPSGTPLQMG